MGNDSKDFSEIHPPSWVNTHHALQIYKFWNGNKYKKLNISTTEHDFSMTS